MIDLILWAPDKATFATFARTNPQANPLQTQDGDGNWNDRQGFEYSWWAGSGLFKTAEGTYDEEGVEITPPSFLPGFVALVRISGNFFEDNVLVPDSEDPDKFEQWARNKVAQYIKTNGTPGTVSGIPYYELDGVRMFRPDDVKAFLQSNSVPGHEWLGGNAY